jgi:hypothetical protein
MSKVLEDARVAESTAREAVARMYAAFASMAQVVAALEAEGRAEDSEVLRSGMAEALESQASLLAWGLAVKKVVLELLDSSEREKQAALDHLMNAQISNIVEWDEEERAEQEAAAAARSGLAQFAAKHSRRNLKQQVYIEKLPELAAEIRKNGHAVTSDTVMPLLEDFEAELREQGKAAPRLPEPVTLDGWLKKLPPEK